MKGKQEPYWLLRVEGGTRYWDSGDTATDAAREALGAPYEGLYVKRLTQEEIYSDKRLTRALNNRTGWTTFRKRPDGLLEEVHNVERPPGETTVEKGRLFRRNTQSPTPFDALLHELKSYTVKKK